ncbi:MAG: hypothetical protein M3P18_09240 [Actinomycetota bacterium]|nr:hypothetical protein [Actinomycetota bacterium]
MHSPRFSPLLKKIALAIVLKKGFDKVQEMRRPAKPSAFGRVAKLGVMSATGGGLFYLFSTGKMKPVIDKVTGQSPDNSTSWNPSESGSGLHNS